MKFMFFYKHFRSEAEIPIVKRIGILWFVSFDLSKEMNNIFFYVIFSQNDVLYFSIPKNLN